MTKRIIESVPNFSEGRDRAKIRQIADAIESVEGVTLLHVDIGAAANRTVMTFVGEPEMVVEAAFRAVRTAAEVIDMRTQHGEHPRIGATDVLPLVPVSGVTLEECAQLARGLAQRIADELLVPCYCYEAAALKPAHRNLAVCRAGEYEALPEKLVDDERKPDIGARPWDERIARTGCTVVGARDFLIAVNFTLDVSLTSIANSIAQNVREKGRTVRDADGNVVRDESGKPVMQPGTLKKVKALGWYIEEYRRAQVSMNITDMNVTPLHVAYVEVCRQAYKHGVQVRGTEIIGLVPERVLLEAGRYFLGKREDPSSASNETLVKEAIWALRLNDLRPFNPEEKVIEYAMNRKK